MWSIGHQKIFSNSVIENLKGMFPDLKDVSGGRAKQESFIHQKAHTPSIMKR